MSKGIKINTNLIKKISSFLKRADSLKYLDPYIFETIDTYKVNNDIDFNDYYLEYISNLPKLDFESVVRISRKVYKSYGKEKEFDSILERIINNYGISVGSLNKDDDNCITKASEDRILLSGTYYDVVLLCHEIGHKLRYDNSMNSTDIMDSLLFETPSIIFEIAASNYILDNYGIDIGAEQLRKMQVFSIKRENGIENSIFSIVIKLLKDRKLNIINLYKEFCKDKEIVEYLDRQDTNIKNCMDEGVSEYSYDIGYILGSYVNSSDNKIGILNMLLKYKDKGISTSFGIDEEIIKSTLKSEKYTK